MPLDPVLVEDIRARLRKAKVDLRSAEVDLAADPPILEDLVFHCQQAVEKAVKGLFTWRQVTFKKTHDLRELSKACLIVDPSLEPVLDEAIPLSWYAWKYRYPGDVEEPTREEALEAWRVARQVFDAILSRLPSEAHP